MGVTLRSAMVIQSNPDSLQIVTGRDSKTDKWGAELWLKHGDTPHELLLSTNPEFGDRKAARGAMQEVVDEVKKVDLSSKVQGLCSKTDG